MEKLSAIRLLRRSGIAEGISFLVLLGIAMPLKYLAGMPMAVKVVGWIHGLLFMLFIYAVIKVYRTLKWDPERIGRALISSVLPFGTLVADRAWRRDEAEIRSGLNP